VAVATAEDEETSEHGQVDGAASQYSQAEEDGVRVVAPDPKQTNKT